MVFEIEKNTLNEVTKNIIEYSTYVTGFVFEVLALLCIYLGYSDIGALALLSVGIAIVSLGIAFHSIRIAEESKDIAKKSDDRMKGISNMNFLDIVDKFEDQRLELYQDREGPYKMELTAWKCRSYSEWANEVQKSVRKKYKELLIRHYIKLIKTFPWKGSVFYLEPTKNKPINRIEIKKDIIALIDVKNILLTYQNLRKFDIDDVTLLDTPMELLESHVGKRNKRESIDRYIERKNEEISLEIKLKGKRHPFIKDLKMGRKNESK